MTNDGSGVRFDLEATAAILCLFNGTNSGLVMQLSLMMAARLALITGMPNNVL